MSVEDSTVAAWRRGYAEGYDKGLGMGRRKLSGNLIVISRKEYDRLKKLEKKWGLMGSPGFDVDDLYRE